MKIRLKKLYERIHKFFCGHCSKCGGDVEMVGYDPDIDSFVYQCKECGYQMF